MPFRLALLVLVVLSGVGTASAATLHKTVLPANGNSPQAQHSPVPSSLPNVLQSPHLHPFWQQFTFGASSTWGITAGPDGNEWVGDRSGERLNRIEMDGTVTTFPTPSFEPYYLTTGSDGRIWMTGETSTQDIAAMTTDGVFSAYVSPSGDHSNGGSELAVGPDKNVWFAETKHIASVTPDGTVSEYLYPSGQNDNEYPSVTVGSDGRIWFTELGSILGAINPKTHHITEYQLPDSGCSLIFGLAAGGDGNLYAVCLGKSFRVSTSGKVLRSFVTPRSLPTATSSTVEAPDGRVWISFGEAFGLIDVYEPGGAVITVPNPLSHFTSIATGPDGNMWGMGGESVNIYLRNRIFVDPHKLGLQPKQSKTLHAAYRGHSTLTATSANPSVASVAPGQQPRTFTVTAVAQGKTTATVQDSIGNSFVVQVSVK